jgi:hypothetical protein
LVVIGMSLDRAVVHPAASQIISASAGRAPRPPKNHFHTVNLRRERHTARF